MNEQTLNTIIQLRHDSAENWATEAGQNKSLAPGEVAVEIVDGKAKLKIGTSADSTFGNSEYFGSDVKEAQVYQSTILSADNEDDDITVIESLIPENTVIQNGDCAIVKRYLVGTAGAVSHTCYVYDSDLGWAAMDGNYSASNVFLNNKITLAGDYGVDSRKDKITSIGNLRIGDEIAAGTSLQSLLMDMLSQRLQPSSSPALPAATIKLYNGSATSEAGAYEVGTVFVPRYTTSLTAGSYTYGPATGITASAWEVSSTGRETTKEGGAEDSSTASSGTFDQFTINEDTSYKLSVKITHNDGAIAVDNLGDTSDPVVQILGGTSNKKTDSSTSVTGYRGCFFGYYSEKKLTPTALTSAEIRALSDAKSALTGFLTYNSSSKIYTTTTDKMQQMFFAAPKGKYTSVAVANNTNGAPQTVTKITDVSVEGANGFTATAYDVWYIDNAGAESGETTFKVTIA